MALKSGGTVNHLHQVFADANQAHAWLSGLHHWGATKTNSNGRSGIRMDVTHAGHRVNATRRSFVEAANGCYEKLKAADTPKLKLAKY